MARGPNGPLAHGRQVVVVTGASRGLGAGLAAAFADEGMRLGLCARTRPARPAGTESVTASVDVTDAEAVDAFAVDVVEAFGGIDLWVNNAGVLAPIGPLADADPDALHRHIDVNILGVLYGSATFARHVRDRPGPGVLVNISSGAATNPYEGWAAYCASKAAVEMISEVIAREEQHHGLVACAVSPGVVDTDMQALVRSTPPGSFPRVDRFHRIHEDQAFNSPAWVAQFIVEHCLDAAGGAASQEGTGAVRLRVPPEPGAAR